MTASGRAPWRALARHRRLTDTAVLSVAQYSALGLGFVSTALITRALGPDQYGVASLVMALPLAIWAFSSMKPILVTTRYIAQFRAAQDHRQLTAVCHLGYAVDFLLAIVALLAVAITAPWMAGSFYGMPEMAWLMIVFAGFLPVTSLSGTNQAVLTGFQAFRLLAAVRFSRGVLMLAFVAIVLSLDGGVRGYVLATGAAQGIATVIETIVVVRVLRAAVPHGLFDVEAIRVMELWRQLRGSLGWTYVHSTFSNVTEQGIIMLLGRFASPAASGYYRLASSLTLGASVPKDAMAKVVYPTLATEWATTSPLQRHSRLVRWTVRAGIPASLTVLLLAYMLPAVISLFFGEGYQPMVSGAQILLLAAAFQALCFWVDAGYLAGGAIGLWARIHVVEGAAALALGSMVIALQGFVGAAIVVAFVRVAAQSVALALLWRAEVIGLARS